MPAWHNLGLSPRLAANGHAETILPAWHNLVLRGIANPVSLTRFPGSNPGAGVMGFMSGSTPSYRRVMVFIDGGYLRISMKTIFKHDNIDFNKLINEIRGNFPGPGVAEVIRTFYYDASVDSVEEPDKFKEQNIYFENVRKTSFFEVKLGRLIKTNGSHRQKGVDVLLSIDMLSKAFENHFDFAVIIAGDDDFCDVVQAVKDTGKRVIGFYFEESMSKRLYNLLDHRVKITSQLISNFEIKK